MIRTSTKEIIVFSVISVISICCFAERSQYHNSSIIDGYGHGPDGIFYKNRNEVSSKPNLCKFHKTGILSEKKVHPSGSADIQKIVNHKINEFEYSQFKDPESFYRPAYFWKWNDTITREIIYEHLTDMNLHGARSVCIHPMPKAFRPNTMFTLMEPDYMTSEYLELYRYAIGLCQKYKMKSYLYDEGGWPSGACLGRVVEQNPSLIIKKLTRQLVKPENETLFSIPDSCLSAFLYQGDVKIRQLTPGTTVTINIDSARIMLFNVTKGATWWPYPYPDLLDPESAREFLRLTHEEYKKTAGDYFGNTIHITFTDEAQAANPGWTEDLADDFKDIYRYDIRDELPSIFEGDSEHDRRIRIDYFDWWSQRHAEAYYGEIQKWCRQNNLLSSGHLNGEDGTVYAGRYGYGHPLRALRRMDIPGVDVIWRQLWPGGNNHHFPKYASSVSHQAGMPWSLTESFAVYGSGLTPDQMKWISDYQLVRGVNLFVMSNYPLSKDDWLIGAIRPMFGPDNPLWRYLDKYHEYIGRMGYLLSLGKPGINIAAYYPVRDIWAGGAELDLICSSNDELVKSLLENQCDFDFIDDDVLESDCSKIVNGQLVVGPMHYDVVCVSYNRYMPEKSVSKLEQFIRAGGKVIWIENVSEGKKPKGIIQATLAELPSLLTPTIALESPNANIRVCKRILANSSVYFVTNEDTCENTCQIRFNESLPVVQLDPESGECRVPLLAKRTSGGWTIPLNLQFAGTGVFIFTGEPLPLVPDKSIPGKVLQTISTGWTCRKTNEFVIGDNDMEVNDVSSEQPVNITPGDWKKVIGENYSGDVEYVVQFRCARSVSKNAKLLDLGDVRYVCQVSLNGVTLGKRLWKPFIYDIGGKIKKGRNILKVTVTNTLANQYIFTKELDKWPVKKLGPYHSRQLGFEKESVSGGLFGPVTIKY